MNNGLMSFDGLLAAVQAGVIYDLTPEGVKAEIPFDHINAASIDVRLGADILVEVSTFDPFDPDQVVCLRDRDPLIMRKVFMDEQGYILAPGEFILAHTVELFNLPDNIACEFKLKSSAARIGLGHLLAGHCDPGWNGSVLTLELHNVSRYHSIHLHPGDKIGQMIFHHVDMVPADRSYAGRGRYNGDTVVSGAKINPLGGEH